MGTAETSVLEGDPTYQAVMDVTFWGSCALFLIASLAALRVQRLTEQRLPDWLREYFGRVPPGFVKNFVIYRFPRWVGWGLFAALEVSAVLEIYGDGFLLESLSIVPAYVDLRYGEPNQAEQFLAVAFFIVPALFLSLWGIVSANRAFVLLVWTLRRGQLKAVKRHQETPIAAFTDEFHWLLRNLRAAIMLWGLVALFGITVFMFVRDSYMDRAFTIVSVGAVLVLYHVVPMVSAASILTGTVRPVRTDLTVLMGELRKKEALAILRGRYDHADAFNGRSDRIADLLDTLPPASTAAVLGRHWWRSVILAVPPILALLSPTIATIVERLANSL